MNKLLLTNVIWMGVLALSGCSNQMITDDPSEEATPVRDSTSLTTRAGKPCQCARSISDEGRRRILLYVSDRRFLRQRFGWARTLLLPTLQRPGTLVVGGIHHAPAAIVGGYEGQRIPCCHGTTAYQALPLLLLGSLRTQGKKRTVPNVLLHCRGQLHRKWKIQRCCQLV